MSELLPESLGQITSEDNQSALTKPRRRVVSDIVEWLQCFGTYIAIISRKQPTRVIDLLGYQSLIIQAYQEHEGDRWLGYDRRFRQQAAATPSTTWSIVDTNLWNLAFSGRGGISRCSHCFSLAHPSTDCELLLPANTGQIQYQTQPPPHPQPQNIRGDRIPYRNRPPLDPPLTTMQPVCYSFNETPKPGCLHPNCRFDHSCYWCRLNPKITNKRHKAIFCPNRSRPSQ